MLNGMPESLQDVFLSLQGRKSAPPRNRLYVEEIGGERRPGAFGGERLMILAITQNVTISGVQVKT